MDLGPRLPTMDSSTRDFDNTITEKGMGLTSDLQGRATQGNLGMETTTGEGSTAGTMGKSMKESTGMMRKMGSGQCCFQMAGDMSGCGNTICTMDMGS